jgi:Predicted membrane protein (DUF2207)
MAAARIALALALLLLGTTATRAQTERITDFVSDVEIRPDSRLDVTETITFRVMGTQIRHGINRDFPTDYRGPWGSRSTTGFLLEEVQLDGESVPTQLSRLKNGVRIRIGDPDRLVPPGIHTYTIRYLTWWQVSFRAAEDGFDWNVTGNGWDWPIDHAELRLHGPEGLVWNTVQLFTGPPGSRAEDARIIAQAPGFLDVVTTRPLSLHEGLTVATSFPKGVLQQPSQLDVAAHWLDDNLAISFSFLGMVGVGFYVGWLFLYGTARPPGVIVPRFTPPNGFSPSMVGYLKHKRLSHRDFSAGIIGLAVARHLKLLHDDRIYRLVRQQGGWPVTNLEYGFQASLFNAGDELSISATYNNRIAGARAALDRLLRRAVMPTLLCKEPRNVWPAVVVAVTTIVLSVAALAIELGGLQKEVIFAIGFSVAGALVLLALRSAATGPGGAGRRIGGSLFVVVVGLAFLLPGLLLANSVSFWLFLVALFLAITAVLAAASFSRLTVPTAEGWKRRDEIAGLKLFLGVAEADRLRVLNPPDFTPALYEKLLPYAIALGVEMVWSRRFAAALAASQTEYQPDWYDGSQPWNGSDVSGFSSDLGSSLAAAVATASAPPSSSGGSSGGSDGGGGSGDGGGGGGGSGW